MRGSGLREKSPCTEPGILSLFLSLSLFLFFPLSLFLSFSLSLFFLFLSLSLSLLSLLFLPSSLSLFSLSLCLKNVRQLERVVSKSGGSKPGDVWGSGLREKSPCTEPGGSWCLVEL